MPTPPAPALTALALAVALVAAACGSDDPEPAAVGSAAADAGATAEPADGEDGTGDSGGDADAGATAEPADGEPADGEDGTGELFPDVLEATAERAADGSWRFSATLSSPYDSPERYADAWRIIGPDGAVLGIRELTHDHAAEQPFTRSLDGVIIDDTIEEVVIEGRDQISGWGGQTVTLDLER